MKASEGDKALIQNLGGPAKVAELLGLPKHGGIQRVQNWMARGIPSAVKVQRPDLFMPNLAALAAADSEPKQPPALAQQAQAAMQSEGV